MDSLYIDSWKIDLILVSTICFISFPYSWLRNIIPNFSKIKHQDVLDAQKEWAKGIINIGRLYTSGGYYKTFTNSFVDELYYSYPNMLFKPTKASEVPIRRTREETISYLIGGAIAEDKGFALAPFSSVNFENNGIIINKDIAIAMGHYIFTNSKTKTKLKVEYTFVYKKCPYKNSLKIILHHSSIPFKPENKSSQSIYKLLF